MRTSSTRAQSSLPAHGLALVVLGALLLAGALQAATPNQFYQYPGTKRMAERLEKIARESNPAHEPYLNAQRAELFRSMISRTDTNDLVKYYDLMTKFTVELLNCGKNQEALQQMDRIEELLTPRHLL